MSEREGGRVELEVLRRMVMAWRDGYSAHAESPEDATFLGRELMLELEEVLYPYLVRLKESGHIDSTEASEFMRFCEAQASELASPV